MTRPVLGSWSKIYGEFKEANLNRGLSRFSIEFYDTYAGRFASWLDEHGVAPAETDSRAVRRFQSEQRRKGLKPRSMHAVARCLRRFTNFATDAGYLNRDQLKIEMPKMPEDLPHWLSENEVSALLASCRQGPNAERDIALCLLAIESGMRRSELSAARWQDLEWKPGELVGRIHVRSGKRGRARTSYFFTGSWKALQALSDEDDRDGLLFRSQRNGPISPHGISEIFNRLSARAGVRLTCHMLRHTAGRRMAVAGIPSSAMMKALGHKTLASLQLYSSFDEQQTESAIVSAFGRHKGTQ